MKKFIISSVIMIIVAMSPVLLANSECVILLHGLARTSASMNKLNDALEKRGFIAVNIDYPSRKKTVEQLAPETINRGLSTCEKHAVKSIHFVTHSMGGILVRYYLKDKKIDKLKRVVMLGPPNKGSQVVDNLKDMPGFELLNGPAGLQMGTGDKAIINKLGPVNFELGIIAGTSSINLILSTMLPDPDDGKVSVENTKVKGMSDFITLPVSHPFLMRDDEVIEQVIEFLRTGYFKHVEKEAN